MVAQEWKSKRGPLHSVDFYRLVLDEAHDIRTAKTHRSQAVCALIAERRWAVTATPLQNDLNDIATLFKFLRYKPLHTKTGFHNHIFAAQTGGKSGMDNLRSAMQAVCLRRTKETIASKLPRRSEQIRFLEFRPDEKQLYEYHKKNLFRINDNDAAALRYLSRLRMICDHGNDLLPAERNSGSSFSESTATCSVCSQPLMPGEGMGCPHRSIRAHAECVELLSGADSSPECEECLASEPRTPGVSPEVPETRFPQYQRPSTKVQALVQAIQNDCSTHYPWPKQ
jgi:SWI/SNF-related matrix-associated actin-dependent regulator of chromatin subfamily A3